MLMHVDKTGRNQVPGDIDAHRIGLRRKAWPHSRDAAIGADQNIGLFGLCARAGDAASGQQDRPLAVGCKERKLIADGAHDLALLLETPGDTKQATLFSQIK
ncbi:hypothetical protein ACVDG7_19755 [Mameliella sp. RP-9]